MGSVAAAVVEADAAKVVVAAELAAASALESVNMAGFAVVLLPESMVASVVEVTLKVESANSGMAEWKVVEDH